MPLELDQAARHVVHRRERFGLYLDGAIIFLAIAAGMTVLFGRLVADQDALAGPLLLSFPIVTLSTRSGGSCGPKNGPSCAR